MGNIIKGSDANLGLDGFLRTMDVADAVKQQREEVGKQLDLDEAKADLKKRLLATAKQSGDRMTELDAETAIKIYFSGLYTFQPPKKGVSTALAAMYVERRRIGLYYGVPLLVAGAISLAIWGSVTAIKESNLNREERAVESLVEQGLRDSKDLGDRLNILSTSPVRQYLPSQDTAEINLITGTAQAKLGENKSFFSQYCLNGSAREAVTRQNYLDVKKQMALVQASITGVKSEVDRGNNIITTQTKLISVKQGLDGLIEQVRVSKPLEVFMQRAEDFYSRGITAVNNRQLSEAQQQQDKLREIKRDAADFSDLDKRIEQTYLTIKGIAKEQLALSKGEGIYQEARTAVTAVNVANLRQAASALSDLSSVLNTEYQDIIIGGDRRVPDDNNTIIRYYIKLERHDSQGNIIPVIITHEETGQRVTVTTRGIRVGEVKLGFGTPESYDGPEPEAYAQVKKDRMDNGVIDNKVFARKPRGYITDQKVLTVGGRPVDNKGEYPY